MKKYCIIIVLSVTCLVTSCIYQRSRAPKEDEFSLFIYRYPGAEIERLQLYHNDASIYNRKLKSTKYNNPQMIFISNLKKGEITNLRFKLVERFIDGHKSWSDLDSTFSVSTMDADSVWISYAWFWGLGISDISPLTELKKEEDEFALFTYLYPPYTSEEMQVYHNDTLLYGGKMKSLYYNPYMMFVSNVKKGKKTRLRLKSMDVDTTFSLSTLDIDSIKIGIASPKIALLFDNHTEEAWISF